MSDRGGDAVWSLGTLLASLVLSYATASFTLRSHQKDDMFAFREAKYANLLVLTKGFMGPSATAAAKQEFIDEEHRAFLYASDSVINALNEIIKFSAKGGGEAGREGKIPLFGDLVVAMRKDQMMDSSVTSDAFLWAFVPTN